MIRRIALFSHDSQGLGHIRRNIELAAAFTRHHPLTRVLLVSGSPAAGTLALPPRTRLVSIPAIGKDGDGGYHAVDGSLTLDQALRQRGQTTAAAVDDFAANLLVVDKHPRGLFGELDDLLDLVAQRRADGDTSLRLVLGLRDVLDERDTAIAEWRREDVSATVQTYYDQIWVYGDPAVFNPVTEYNVGALADKVRFTGYLSRGRGSGLASSAVPVPERPYVLGLVGGGQDGADLADGFVKARIPEGHLGVLVAGPYLDPALASRLTELSATRDDLLVLPSVPTTVPLVEQARAVVSMGGYNTVCEVLATAAPALVVPRVRPRTEQAIRADLLAATTHIDTLRPHLANPEAIGDWLEGAVRRPARDHRIDLDGLSRIPRLADDLLHAPRPSPAGASHVAA